MTGMISLVIHAAALRESFVKYVELSIAPLFQDWIRKHVLGVATTDSGDIHETARR